MSRLGLSLSLILLCLSACAEEADRPFGGGGGGGGSGGGKRDGGSLRSDAMGAKVIKGRLCLAIDMRDPLRCDTDTGLGGIAMDIGGQATTSSDDGSFSVPATDDLKALVKIAEGDDGYRDIVSSITLEDDGQADVRLPLIADATWQSLLTQNGLLEPDGTASIAIYLKRGGQPITGAQVIPPAGSEAPRYDGSSINDPNDWVIGANTGSKGAAIVVRVSSEAPTTNFELFESGKLTSISDVPVLPDFLSFVPISLY